MKEVIKKLATGIFMIWLLLTIIVFYFLFDRFTNPGYKGISNTDLIDYGKISIVILAIFIGTKFIKDK
jgi:hypothetical protein